MQGVFLEQPTDPHVQLRSTLLGWNALLPSPPAIRSNGSQSAEHLIRGCGLLDRLAQFGLCVLERDEPMTDREFIRLGSLLGNILPETDPSVQPHVDEQVILNVVSVHSDTNDVTRQPFAVNSLSLHTESSGRPLSHQPRYIVLMCVEPGEATAARTVLVPMTSVENMLSSEAIEVLTGTRYHRQGVPYLVRNVGNRRVFSFRDFVQEPLHWTHDRGAEDQTAIVNCALRELLAGMYSATDARAITWKTGLLVVIDNTYFFHGRAAAAGVAGLQRRRHLKRLRILERG